MTNLFHLEEFRSEHHVHLAYGQEVYRDDGKFLEGGIDGNWNQTTKVLDAWTPENPDGTVQRLTWQPDNRNYNTPDIWKMPHS
jgi:hypothetical protein